MKNLLLVTAAFAMVATTSLAQGANVEKKNSVKIAGLTRQFDAKNLVVKNVAKSMATAPRKTAATGLYYTRPTGSYVSGITKDGMGAYVNYIIAAPFKNVVYNNKSTDPSKTRWTINGNDATQFADAAGNLDMGSFGFYDSMISFYNPSLTDGTNTYMYGETGQYFAQRGNVSYARVDSLGPISNSDDRLYKTKYAWGGLSTNYLYGSGTVTFKEEDGSDLIAVSQGVVQPVEAPMSPLYVEDVYMQVYTKSVPVSGDAKLNLYIIATKEENGTVKLTTDTIAKLAATAADTVKLFGPEETKYGSISGYNVIFSQKIKDEFGLDAVAPFTIDKPYAFVLTGCENPNVDIDILASEAVGEEASIPARAILTDGKQPWQQPLYKGAGMVVNFNMTAMFDYVEVQNQIQGDDGTVMLDQANVVRVSADGKTIKNEKAATDEDNLGGVMALTSLPWVDNNGLPNYMAVNGLPDWILDINCLQDGHLEANMDERNGAVLLAPVCEPLPAGTEGRVAVIELQGRGYKSKASIIVLQGNAEIPTAISSVENNKVAKAGKTFNLAGQQVSAAAKGILINNGKKYVNNK